MFYSLAFRKKLRKNYSSQIVYGKYLLAFNQFFLRLQQSVPPIMAFHLGSLGFLTPFKFENFQEQVTNVLEGKYLVLELRNRAVKIFMTTTGIMYANYVLVALDSASPRCILAIIIR